MCDSCSIETPELNYVLARNSRRWWKSGNFYFLMVPWFLLFSTDKSDIQIVAISSFGLWWLIVTWKRWESPKDHLKSDVFHCRTCFAKLGLLSVEIILGLSVPHDCFERVYITMLSSLDIRIWLIFNWLLSRHIKTHLHKNVP